MNIKIQFTVDPENIQASIDAALLEARSELRNLATDACIGYMMSGQYGGLVPDVIGGTGRDLNIAVCD